jgi:hypothetical protein
MPSSAITLILISHYIPILACIQSALILRWALSIVSVMLYIPVQEVSEAEPASVFRKIHILKPVLLGSLDIANIDLTAMDPIDYIVAKI